jgi:hypothetical protein
LRYPCAGSSAWIEGFSSTQSTNGLSGRSARALDSSSSLQGMPAIIENITEGKRAEGDLNDAREALALPG